MSLKDQGISLFQLIQLRNLMAGLPRESRAGFIVMVCARLGVEDERVVSTLWQFFHAIDFELN